MHPSTPRAGNVPRAILVLGPTLVASLFAGQARSLAQSAPTLVSVDPSSMLADGDSTAPSISDDGRFVAFASHATNLVANDANSSLDVFLHDRASGLTTLVSRDSNGAAGNSTSLYPAISGDGNVVVFSSRASNLVPNDTNSMFDVFVRDLSTGQTTRASVDSSGLQADGDSYVVALSFDGRFLAFVSAATNLVPADANQHHDVFVHDRSTLQTTRVSVSSAGAEADGPSVDVSISGDGRFVAFSSLATNLVTNDTNGTQDVFVHDRLSGVTTRVSVASSGAQGSSVSGVPAFSADGRWIAFESESPDLVPGDVNVAWDVFVHDRQTGQTSLVSLNSNGVQGTSSSNGPEISANGRFVTFWTASTNFAPTMGLHADLYVRDRQLATLTLVSAEPNGSGGNGSSYFSAISGDGRVVAFESNASDLAPGDTNGFQDIFAREMLPPSHPAFCFGDGSGTACPCGNSSVPGAGEGCLSSLGAGGVLTGTGSASVAADGVVLSGSQMPSSFALYFQGTTALSGGNGIPFGDGLRCAGGSIVRLATKINVSGSSTYPEAGDPSVSVRGNCQPGDFRTYQVWYRNAAPFCTSSTFNLTSGVNITWAP
jgi:Tol biopolymer transport system component